MHHTLYDGRRIAFRYTHGIGPALVFLPGYMSDMAGSKATALFAEAQERGRACLLLDYSGCGQSAGDFADGMLSRWRDEVLALIASYVAGPVLLVGSSMGGWLMLLVAEHLQASPCRDDRHRRRARFHALGLHPGAARRASRRARRFTSPTPMAPNPRRPMPQFFADAECHLRLERAIDLTCPVRLIHGKAMPTCRGRSACVSKRHCGRTTFR